MCYVFSIDIITKLILPHRIKHSLYLHQHLCQKLRQQPETKLTVCNYFSFHDSEVYNTELIPQPLYDKLQ